MMRLYPGIGVNISWEPDCSPQVMTVITSSLGLFLEPQAEIMTNQKTPDDL
jgi:hypothetical protein